MEKPDPLESVRTEVIVLAKQLARGRGGWSGIDRPALVRQFAGQASPASIYRWIDQAKRKSSSTDAAPGKPRKDAAPSPAPISVPVSALSMPVENAPVEAVQVAQLIRICLQAAQDVQAASRGPDGKPRNGKMMLRATDTLRRSLETAVKLQEAINREEHMARLVENYIHRMQEAVKRESPDCARRILLGQTEIIGELEQALEKV
jgi:hypothetical protein